MEDRLKHSLGVATKMVEIVKNLGLDNEQLNELFLLGYVHDIGYFIDKNDHNVSGGDILKLNGYKFYNEIYNHGKIDSCYESLYLDILNSADMQIDKFGNDVSYEGRLKDIGSRYGRESDVYKNCDLLIKRLKNKYY